MVFSSGVELQRLLIATQYVSQLSLHLCLVFFARDSEAFSVRSFVVSIRCPPVAWATEKMRMILVISSRGQVKEEGCGDVACR